jgi:putative flippase GtrA
MIDLFKRIVSRQFIKFCLIGLETTIFTYLIFIILLYFLSVNYLISSGIGFLAGILLGFIFNKLYTFESERKNIQTFPKYLLIYSFSLAVNLLGLKMFVEHFMIPSIIANIFMLPITTIINFFGTKILAFKDRRW